MKKAINFVRAHYARIILTIVLFAIGIHWHHVASLGPMCLGVGLWCGSE